MIGLRERQVLEAAAAGERPRETAARLHLSAHTVSNYRHRACLTLGARTLPQAIALAIEKGVLKR